MRARCKEARRSRPPALVGGVAWTSSERSLSWDETIERRGEQPESGAQQHRNGRGVNENRNAEGAPDGGGGCAEGIGQARGAAGVLGEGDDGRQRARVR